MLTWNEVEKYQKEDPKSFTTDELKEAIRKLNREKMWNTAKRLEKELYTRQNKENNRIMVNGLNDYPHAK